MPHLFPKEEWDSLLKVTQKPPPPHFNSSRLDVCQLTPYPALATSMLKILGKREKQRERETERVCVRVCALNIMRRMGEMISLGLRVTTIYPQISSEYSGNPGKEYGNDRCKTHRLSLASDWQEPYATSCYTPFGRVYPCFLLASTTPSMQSLINVFPEIQYRANPQFELVRFSYSPKANGVITESGSLIFTEWLAYVT